MDSRDRRLGMDQAISRRDFLNGVGVTIGASLLPACGRNSEPVAVVPPAYYPPAEVGMRGSHPGSFEAAHAAAQGQRWVAKRTGEHYDLVVVGAGISGLSAAYIYRRDVDPDARILILDNHDDFGGHARRNEFSLDGRTLIGFGGTYEIEAPSSYPAVAKQMITELGIDAHRYSDYHDENLFRSLGMGEAGFYDRETFGADYLAAGSFGYSEAVANAPLTATAKEQLARLFADQEDYLAGMTPAQRREVLESHTWRAYLEKFAGMGEEVLAYIQKWPHAVWGIGADATPAWLAWRDGYPGFAGMDPGYGVTASDGADEQGFHFPDGNASVARLLVRRLVPGVAPGHSMEDVVTARFDGAQLDGLDNATRIRLSSTVVEVKHRDGELDADVELTYVTGNEGRSVTAAKVIWAGYHAMVPHICPDVPQLQREAQSQSVRAPLVYANVLIRNWHSFAKLGLRRAYCPGSFYPTVMISYPVSIGGHQASRSPDEPVIVHLQYMPLEPGLPAADQFRAGREALLQTSFETFERNARDQLGRVLGPGGFDPARDIAGMTVNRWAHGYAYSIDAGSGDVAWYPKYWQHERRPWVDARQRVGNIAFAGTDASSNGMTESAIEEAHRAVHSLVA